MSVTPPWLLNPSSVEDKAPAKKKSGVKRIVDKILPKAHTPIERRTKSGYRSVQANFKAIWANGAKHAVSKYTPDHAFKLLEYFGVEGYTADTGQDFCGTKGYHVDGKREGVRLPTISGFCVKVMISPATYHRWAYDLDEDQIPKYPEFAEANAMIKCIQEDILVNNGLNGYYNSPFAKFILNTYHEKVEKSARDINMSGAIIINIDKDEDDL